MTTAAPQLRPYVPLLTRAQVAERLNVSGSTLNRIRARDESFPPPMRVSCSYRWRLEDLDRWLDEQAGAA